MASVIHQIRELNHLNLGKTTITPNDSFMKNPPSPYYTRYVLWYVIFYFIAANFILDDGAIPIPLDSRLQGIYQRYLCLLSIYYKVHFNTLRLFCPHSISTNRDYIYIYLNTEQIRGEKIWHWTKQMLKFGLLFQIFALCLYMYDQCH